MVGLEGVDDGIWSTHFCPVLPGRVDETPVTHVAGSFCYLSSRLLTSPPHTSSSTARDCIIFSPLVHASVQLAAGASKLKRYRVPVFGFATMSV